MDESAGVAVQERDAGSEAPRGSGSLRSKWTLRLAVAALIVGVLVWVLSADSLDSHSGISSWGAAEVGEPFHIGEAGMIDGDLAVLWARPRIVGDADVTVRVCRRAGSDQGGAIGTMQGDAELEASCPELEPLRRGTRLKREVPEGTSLDYVLITLVPESGEPVAYCGLDVAYRSGLRFGLARAAGAMKTVLYPDGRSPKKPDELC